MPDINVIYIVYEHNWNPAWYEVENYPLCAFSTREDAEKYVNEYFTTIVQNGLGCGYNNKIREVILNPKNKTEVDNYLESLRPIPEPSKFLFRIDPLTEQTSIDSTYMNQPLNEVIIQWSDNKLNKIKALYTIAVEAINQKEAETIALKVYQETKEKKELPIIPPVSQRLREIIEEARPQFGEYYRFLERKAQALLRDEERKEKNGLG